jgi:ubiquinone/menaquinone biosynthesis C-methylase UbiE
MFTGKENVILPVEYWQNEFKTGWKNGQYPDAHLLKFLEEHCPEIGPKVLDVGSGDGRHLVPMAQLGFNMTGLELIQTGIDTTRKKLTNFGLSATLVQGDFHELPFKEESFDTVISVQVLHYNNWLGCQKAFQEISRVLKPSGFFFFRARSEKGHWRPTDCQIEDYEGITRIEARGIDKFIVMVHDYTFKELKSLASLYGFTIESSIDEDCNGTPGQWNVVFRKL